MTTLNPIKIKRGEQEE